jgi:hypothetical protein
MQRVVGSSVDLEYIPQTILRSLRKYYTTLKIIKFAATIQKRTDRQIQFRDKFEIIPKLAW